MEVVGIVYYNGGDERSWRERQVYGRERMKGVVMSGKEALCEMLMYHNINLMRDVEIVNLDL